MYPTEQLSDGVWIEEIPGDEIIEFQKSQTYFDKFVRFQPSGQVFPKCFARYERHIAEFAVRADDVWVASFPKCGTTWTQEMVWNIVNNMDIDKANMIDLEKRVPFVELSGLLGEDFTGVMEDTMEEENNKQELTTSFSLATSLASPRKRCFKFIIFM